MGTHRPWYFLVQKQYWSDSWERVKSVYADVLRATKNRNTRVHAGCDTDTGAGAPGVGSEGGGLEMGSREDPLAFIQGGMHPPMAMAALEPSDTVETLDPSMTEALDSGGGVRIRNLRKEFDTPSGVKVAVDDFSLDVCPDQVTVMLGHNGAGKTTTIGMMTGLIPATAGSVSVGGLSISTSMSAIRQDLGVCPQHDVLFMDLTVDEHLALFADLKLVPPAQIPSVVDAMVAEVGLVAKRHEQASKLSGGQKRKLSIAIAFIGDPRVVFLDEPTSGMDPYSRRFTWGLINKLKRGRVIILTTHFTDEADILGDRIAIMGKGKLKCCGSSLFLKSRFGIGYNMTIEKSSEVGSSSFSFQQQDVERAISDDGIADWKLLSNVGSEVIYQVKLALTPCVCLCE